MTAPKPYPSFALVAKTAWARAAFPWLIFLICWAIFFVLENKMDAPLTALEDRVVSDVAQSVSDGDAGHKVMTVFLGALGAFLLYKHRQKLRVHPVMMGLFIAYLSWIFMGAVTADDPELTVRRIGGYVFNLLLCAGFAVRMDMDSNAVFMAGIPTLTLIPDVIAELKCHGLEALTPGGRFGGTYPHPNVAAAALAIPVIVFTWLVFRTRGTIRMAVAALDLVVIIFFVLTRSRTSILAVLVAMAFSVTILVLRSQRRQMGRLIGVGMLAVGLIGLAGLAANSSHDGLNLLSAVHSERDEGDPTTLTGRVDLWKTVIEYAYERPMLGFGFGGFWSAKHIETISEEQKWPINQSHSAYIDMVLALGFPGAMLHVMVLFGGLLICTIRFFRYNENTFGVSAAVLVFIAMNSFTEAISLAPGYLSVVLSLITLQLALVNQPLKEKPIRIPNPPHKAPVHASIPLHDMSAASPTYGGRHLYRAFTNGRKQNS